MLVIIEAVDFIEAGLDRKFEGGEIRGGEGEAVVDEVGGDLGGGGVGRPVAFGVDFFAVVLEAGEVGHEGVDSAGVDVVVLCWGG